MKTEDRNNFKDRVQGIAKGTAPSMVPTVRPKKEEEYIPDMAELGLAVNLRRQLESDVARCAMLGAEAKAAEKERKPITERVKTFLQTHLADVPKFFCGSNRVTIFTTQRTVYTEESVRAALIKYRVAPQSVAGILKEGGITSESVTLLITAPKEEM